MERAGRPLTRSVLAVLRHPSLWWIGAVQLFVLARPGWWRRWPPVPVPDREYLAFRMRTQYGDADHPPEPADLLAYLKWCRGERRALR